mmetsp:Transcript_79473/g.233595  ORF Transcript_79473/g.233595 Transcript_79473/m.233595 type:complete len:496 (+) Transcript_79473:56-1543(+)
MAGWREEKAGLLAGTEQSPEDVEGCPPPTAAPASAEAAAPAAGLRGARRSVLAALAMVAVGAAMVCVATAGLRGAPRGVPAPANTADVDGLVMDQQVYQPEPGVLAEPEPGVVAAPAGDAVGYPDTTGVDATAAGSVVDGAGAADATDPYGASNFQTTAPPYTGPTEFNGKGGPPSIAGTKLISAGVDDTEEFPHAPVPAPPEDYGLQNPPLTMYMYRAQSESDYPMRNVNTGDLAGVLWYLHNEIVAFPDPEYRIRHFNITRIIRFKVTIQNPPEFFEQHGRKFGAYVAFGAGKCSVPYCDSMWRKYGGLVGCQAADTKVANYHSMWKTQSPDSHCGDRCDAPLWFSLPGPCPSHEYGAKTADCVWDFPGGDCGKGNEVNGAKDCTYFAQWYGQVHLDELLNFTFSDGRKATFAEFTAAGGVEYDKVTDQGVYTNFWDGVHDEDAGRARLQAVRYLFQTKYPRYPTELQETDILCDFDGWDHGEFAPYPAPGAQ